MLNPKIADFIDMLVKLNARGCLTVPAVDTAFLLTSLRQSGCACAYELITPKMDLREYGKTPFFFIVTEEDYSSDAKWTEAVRRASGYFLNVKNEGESLSRNINR